MSGPHKPATRANGMAVIPAHNEEATVGDIVAGARESGLAVVVVDDQSLDLTAQRARQAGAVVLAPCIRQGAWGATQVGLRYALARGADFAVTLDADGQHDPSDIPGLLEPFRAGSCEVVIGICPARADGMRKLAWRLFRTMTGLDLQDITSGFRVYSRPAMEALLSPEAVGFDYQDVNVLLLLKRHGFRFREIRLAMARRQVGESKIFSSWWRILVYMIHTFIICTAKSAKGRD